jgi:hypothetical protein
MDEVTASAAKASAIDREALANRLELPAMPAPPGAFMPRQTIVKGIGDLLRFGNNLEAKPTTGGSSGTALWWVLLQEPAGHVQRIVEGFEFTGQGNDFFRVVHFDLTGLDRLLTPSVDRQLAVACRSGGSLEQFYRRRRFCRLRNGCVDPKMASKATAVSANTTLFPAGRPPGNPGNLNARS